MSKLISCRYFWGKPDTEILFCELVYTNIQRLDSIDRKAPSVHALANEIKRHMYKLSRDDGKRFNGLLRILQKMSCMDWCDNHYDAKTPSASSNKTSSLHRQNRAHRRQILIYDLRDRFCTAGKIRLNSAYLA